MPTGYDARAFDQAVIMGLANEGHPLRLTMRGLLERLQCEAGDVTASLARLEALGVIRSTTDGAGSETAWGLSCTPERALDAIGWNPDGEPREPVRPRAQRLDELVDVGIDYAEAANRGDVADAATSLDRLLSARLKARELEASPQLDRSTLRAAADRLRRVAVMLGQVQERQGRLAPPDGPGDLDMSGAWQVVRVVPEGFEDIEPGELARLSAILLAASQ